MSLIEDVIRDEVRKMMQLQQVPNDDMPRTLEGPTREGEPEELTQSTAGLQEVPVNDLPLSEAEQYIDVDNSSLSDDVTGSNLEYGNSVEPNEALEGSVLDPLTNIGLGAVAKIPSKARGAMNIRAMDMSERGSNILANNIKKAKATAGQFNLTLEICREIPIPLCSLSEQRQIVREIESRLSVCDEVERSIFQSLEKAAALRQSILKKAFEGKLLTSAELDQCKQADDYEPASVLLERITAEKKR